MFFHFLQLIPPLFVAVICHEVAHGWMAEKLGDPTARNAGRISLNPLVHIDPFLTIILPSLLIITGSPVVFGGAKPVPIGVGYFKNRDRAMMLVAAAGPMTNFTLAALCLGAVRLLSDVLPVWAGVVFYIPLCWIVYGFFINLMLGVFNLIPLLPLDGGRILCSLLPRSLQYWYSKTEKYGLILLVLVLYSNALDSVFESVRMYAESLLFNQPQDVSTLSE